MGVLAPWVEGVGSKGVRVGPSTVGDTKGDTVRVGLEERVEVSVACPDWLAVCVGLEGVGKGVVVAEGVEGAVKVGEGDVAVERVGKVDPEAVPQETALVVESAEGVADKLSPIEWVLCAEGLGGNEGASEAVGFEGVGGKLCPAVSEGAKEGVGGVEGRLDTEGGAEGKFEAEPAPLSLPLGVGVLGRVPPEEGEAALAVGDEEGAREGVGLNVPWGERVLKAECVAPGAEAEAGSVGAGVDERGATRVTVPDPDGVDCSSGLSLGRVEGEVDGVEDMGRVAREEKEGSGLRLDESDAPEEALAREDTEGLLERDCVWVALGLPEPDLEGGGEGDPKGGVEVGEGGLEGV